MYEVSNFALKTGNNLAQKTTAKDIEIIESIVITVAITCHSYIESHGRYSPGRLAKGYSKLGSSNSKLAFTSLISNLYNLDYTTGKFPEQINKQIAQHLLNRYTNYMNLPNLSKLLKKLEPYNIFCKVEGKKKIKLDSPKSLPRKPKAGLKKRGGYLVIRKTTRSVEDYKRIIGNPDTLMIINRKLAKYNDLLRSFYELFVDDILEAIKQGNQNANAFLTACITSTFPDFDRDKIDLESYKKALENRAQKDLEEDKKAFLAYLLQNPNPRFFFILSLTGLHLPNPK